jgi:DNA repair exonuclease SbcCD ATPase subunit
MKMKHVLLILALAGFISCGTDDDDKTDSSQKQAKETVSDFEDIKTEAIDDFQSRMKSLNDKAEELERILEDETIELSEKEINDLNAAIDEYEDKKESLKDKFYELQNASKGKWDDVKNEFVSTLQPLEDNVDDNFTKAKVKTNLQKAKERITAKIEEIETSENYQKLKEMQDKIIEQLDKLEEATEDQWKAIKDGTNNLLEEIENTFK